jgi:transcriptional regulator with XRE-family HTH domain
MVPVDDAVRKLRTAFGDSQEAFAKRLGTGVRTIARYESNQSPPTAVLAKLWRLAKNKRLDFVADAFAAVVQEQMHAILQDPAFTEELARRIAGVVGPGYVAADLTTQEKDVMIAMLATLRACKSEERSRFIEFTTDVEKFRQTVWRASLMCDLEEKLAASVSRDGKGAGPEED